MNNENTPQDLNMIETSFDKFIIEGIEFKKPNKLSARASFALMKYASKFQQIDNQLKTGILEDETLDIFAEVMSSLFITEDGDRLPKQWYTDAISIEDFTMLVHMIIKLSNGGEEILAGKKPQKKAKV